MKHKHADVIKAWADGAQIEWRFPEAEDKDDREWTDAMEYGQPEWSSEEAEFRIKTATDEQTDDSTGICEVEA